MRELLTNDLLQTLEEAKNISSTQPKISLDMSKKVYHVAKRKKLENEEAYSLIVMSFACRSMSNIKDCIKYSYQALKIYEKIHDNLGQAKALNLIGIVYFYYSMYEQALENFEKSVLLLEDLEDNSYLLSCVLNNIGEVYRETNDYKKSLATFDRCLNIPEASKYKTNTAAIYSNIGKVYIKEKKYSMALSFFKKSYAILLNEKEPIMLAEAENNIADIYMFRQDINSAEKYLIDAFNRLDNIHNKFYIIDVLTSLGQLEIAKGSDNFMYYFEKALDCAEEMKAKKKLLRIYTILYQLYESKNDSFNALKYFKKSHYIELELETSIQSQRLEIINFELKYLKANTQIDKISKLNHRLSEEIKSQKDKIHAMQKLNSDLNKKALYDELTEIPNRHYIKEYFKTSWKRASLENFNIAFYIMDIDNFKSYNDFWGHNKGDECLRAISDCLKKVQNTKEGFFGRYGGEEFIYLIENIDFEEAVSIGNTLKNEVESLNIKYNFELESTPVTISIGAFYGKISDSLSFKDIIQIADKELYKAKASGRNKLLITKI